jgi:hypothetical protein
MSLEQYKNANRKELWSILQTQAQVLKEEIARNAELCKIAPCTFGGRIEALIKRNAELEKTLKDTAIIWGGKLQELEKERDELKLANTEAKTYIESELGPIFHNVYPHKTFNPKVHQAIRDLEQHDKGVDSAIAELTICYRVALDEHKDYEDAEVLEGLIDSLQALKDLS